MIISIKQHIPYTLMHICKELLAMQRMLIVHFKFSKYVHIIYIDIHRKITHTLTQILF